MNVKKGKWLVVLLAIAMLATVGSAGVPNNENGNGCDDCVPFLEVDLIAGQNMVVGTVTVANDDEKVCVTYALDEDALEAGWLIYETHLAIAPTGGDEHPYEVFRSFGWVNRPGNPSPGQFPYGDDELDGVEYWSYCVSLEDLDVEFCEEVFIAAHAVVKRFVGMEAESATIYGNISGYTGSGPQGDIYIIDPLEGTETLFFDNPSTNFEANWYPNALAYDEDNDRLYYTTHRSKLVFYDLIDEVVKEVADPNGLFSNPGDVLGATFGDGYYWYILNQSNFLYRLELESDGDGNVVVQEREQYAMITGIEKPLSQGDIEYKEGIIYGSSGTGAGGGNNFKGFFSYDIADDEFTAFEKGDGYQALQLAWGLDADGDKVLYGCRKSRDYASDWYTVDITTGEDTPVDTIGETYYYMDLASKFIYEEIWESETAWGKGDRFVQRGSWGMWFKYKICEPDNGNGEECQTETAWGGNTPGGNAAWWFYYDASVGGVQTLWAGQDIDIGTVEVVDGSVSIILTGGWELQDDDEAVKIQGYHEIPDSRPASGGFSYKGTDLTDIDIGEFYYYAIHLDVQLCE